MQRRTRQGKAAAAQRTSSKKATTTQPTRKAAKPVVHTRGPDTQEILMGIDLGSSGIRATISPPDESEEIMMIYNGEDAADGYAFSAHGYVFDHFDDIDSAQIHKQSLDDDGRLSVSLKYAFYILSDAPKTLKKEYPLLRRMIEEDDRNREDFRRKLRLGLVQMFRWLIGKVEETIKTKRAPWRVGKLRVTVPSQWDLRFEGQYRSILAESFGWDAETAHDRIRFSFEAEALAHFLVRSKHYENEAIAQLKPGEHRVMLVFDFGGHNMNGCQYWINSKRGETLNFFRMGKPFGVGSGTEHMVDYILSACEKYRIDNHEVPLSDNAKAQLLVKIRSRRAHYGPGSPTARDEETFEFFDSGSNGIGGGAIRLTKDIIDQCWEKAFQPAIEEVEKRLKALAKSHKRRGRPNPLVVMAGGSLMNKAFGLRLDSLVQLYRLDPALLVNKRTGAAIGLQMRQAGQEEGRGDWDNKAYLLYFYNVEAKQEVFPTCVIPMQAGDRLRLVCDPFYGQDEVKKRGPLRGIDHKRSYDLIERLPLNPRNRQYECRVGFHDGGDKMAMTLSIVDEFPDSVWEIPLYFDNGTRCILPGKRGVPLRDAVPDLFLGLATEEDDEMEGSEDDVEMEDVA
ncbi:hypothetical protein GE21DRAFT_5370 [Neurospora crassa]|uniref:Actin-like ATPase domain-containing protein n=1 Tax=Neurospora crassa (strain ATCC 24698 / 74-OR23-1A / CBS 708.71 / DSM 1257 / FGSC 987) TaxID=367110 RepID=Q7S3U8_NEUCR|nr:hypothetical protein NCU04919 [Neurospora crassa OR74A]EAA30131.3 hypothetical protein NCU04919 [Neurospora crassa OR74A]KHE79324.1 hypothetical protein GE21DRAFT_5370 [Neurospora crassa]|eukprot:XP_959367.3 hypothetical protein NCU04919 [Neurospora crassa OR74A]